MKEIAVLSLQSAQDMVRPLAHHCVCLLSRLRGCMCAAHCTLSSVVFVQIEDRKNSFEIYGYDFMIDANYCPWLIEINSSPDFSYSTEVTKVLVKEASEDIVKVIVDYRYCCTVCAFL
jgi:hypothetical protein